MTIIENKISCYALPGVQSNITSEYIIGVISRRMNVTLDELCSRDRHKEVLFTRQCCLYFMRKLTKMNLEKIGKTLKHDHATVLHSIKVIENMKLTRHGEFYDTLKAIELSFINNE